MVSLRRETGVETGKWYGDTSFAAILGGGLRGARKNRVWAVPVDCLEGQKNWTSGGNKEPGARPGSACDVVQEEIISEESEGLAVEKAAQRGGLGGH